MQPIFISKDILELVIDGYDMPYDDEHQALDTNDKQKLKETIKKDNEALCLIGIVVDDSIFP